MLSFFKKDNPVIGVDLFTLYPLAYEQLLDRSVLKRIDDVDVRVSGLADLITMKSAVGRPRDFEDVKALKRIQSDAGTAEG